MPPFDVVGIGENSVDTVCRVASAVAPNTKIPIVGQRVMLGGQVATTLATCASFGLRVAYVGAFGSDPAAATLRDALNGRGVDTSRCVVRDVRNRSAVIVVDEQNGDRTVLWDRDRQLDLRPEELPVELIANARLLHVDDVDCRTAMRAAAVAREAGVPVTTDFDRVTEPMRELLSTVSIPILAESMPGTLTGEADPERALRALRQPQHQMLCATLGVRGAVMLAGDRVHRSPAFTVDAVDTTGAGDVFRGAFIAAMLRGEQPDEILRFANAAAAIACTREGALDSVPSLDEVRSLL